MRASARPRLPACQQQRTSAVKARLLRAGAVNQLTLSFSGSSIRHSSLGGRCLRTCRHSVPSFYFAETMSETVVTIPLLTHRSSTIPGSPQLTAFTPQHVIACDRTPGIVDNAPNGTAGPFFLLQEDMCPPSMRDTAGQQGEVARADRFRQWYMTFREVNGMCKISWFARFVQGMSRVV